MFKPTTSVALGQAPYDDLPAAVTAVADEIGLEDGDGVKMLAKSLGENDFDQVRHHAFSTKNIGRKIATYSLERKSKRKNKPKVKKDKDHLTSNQRRQLFDVTKSKDLRYSVLKGLNDLWEGYMQSVLSTINSPADQLRLVRADYHGAKFVVSAARNTALVGLKGIVIQETKNTFRMIQEENRVITVPKIGSIFAFYVHGSLFKLNGSQMAMSPHQRARTKPKVRAKIDLKKEV